MLAETVAEPGGKYGMLAQIEKMGAKDTDIVEPFVLMLIPFTPTMLLVCGTENKKLWPPAEDAMVIAPPPARKLAGIPHSVSMFAPWI